VSNIEHPDMPQRVMMLPQRSIRAATAHFLPVDARQATTCFVMRLSRTSITFAELDREWLKQTIACSKLLNSRNY
jgi:chromosome condensin MukBEF complex kleisin-like MukF subunit